MTQLLTQTQVEEQMYYGGVARSTSSMENAEKSGRADQNPYAKAILREFIGPIAEVLREECVNKPGVLRAHANLLKALDPEAVAVVALRTTITWCMSRKPEDVHHRNLGNALGGAIHAELILTQFEDLEPDLYNTLARDLGRRRSKNLKHRLNVYKNQANKFNIDLIEWPVGARDQVGLFLLGVMHRLEFIEIGESKRNGVKHTYKPVGLSPYIMEKIEKIKGFVAITTPVYGPCVEPPRPWTTPTDGGFHTKLLRRSLPCVVKSHPNSRDLYRDGEWVPSTFLQAVNNMQNTAWKVNTRLLDTIISVAEEGNFGEIVSISELPKPSPLPWLTPDMKKEDMTPVQLESFLAWKRATADWHTQCKLLRGKFGRFYAATRAAQMFRAYHKLYFVYFADSRGRLYPMTYGVNPQGSDLQKALLQFAEGKEIYSSPEAVLWFHVLGANKFGYDKDTLAGRMKWVTERSEWILAIAADPVNNRDWLQADNPLQFLAWCFEYADWKADPKGFKSALPVGLDGSCNGLQHLSAMTRDTVGGAATNLLPADTMQDIYGRVAKAAETRMAAFSYLGEGADEAAQKKEAIRLKWLEHGISRSAVKRSVMTTPYGVTRRSATDYVISDYLAAGSAPCFDRKEYYLAAAVLMEFVWPAIGDIVVKGRLVMDWLKRGAGQIVKNLDDSGVIFWDTPSGFRASQSHFEFDIHRIQTRLFGTEKIRLPTETDRPDASGHKAGLAPNFIHSLDAAHLHLCSAKAPEVGITSLAMIHDDYGTHAADAEKLYWLIREQFVWLYENHDPLLDLQNKYGLQDPPAKGDLDIKAVLQSEFFFS